VELSCLGLATLGLGTPLLLRRLLVAGETTLRGPGLWLLAAVAGLALVSAGARLGWGPPAYAAQFVAASLTICPVVSVLGAKRPQNRAWHFVVAALFVVLVLPVMDSLVLGRGEPMELHVVRRVFLALLIGMGLANYLGTRFWASALLYAAGQIVLFGHALFPRADWTAHWGLSLGSLLIGSAVLLVGLGIPRRRTPPSGLTRAWLDFRDAFGAAWALRVADRLNRAAVKLSWDVRLTWSGFVHCPGSPDEPQQTAAAARSFRMLLRRFVDPKSMATENSF
jgi:hypothetical protein